MTTQIKQRINQLRRGEVPEGYINSKSGIIPAEWMSYTLGDIYTERKEPGNPSLPILTVSIHSGVSDGSLDDDELGKKVKRIEDRTQYRTTRSGDLVFNMMRAWQGAIGVVRSDGLVSPAYIVATPDEALVHPPFMDYYMKTPEMVNRIHRKSYGVTDFRLRLYWDSFAMIDCALPPLAAQKKIAEILSAQDKLITLKEKLIEEKKRQKKYLMQQLLTGQKRLPGFSGVWESLKIGSLGLLKSGNGFPEKYQGVRSGSIPFFKVSDMNTDTNSVYLTTAQNYISNAIAQNIKINILPPKAIVFAKVGAAISLERKKILLQESAIDNNMMAYLPIKINDLFAYYWFLNTRLSDLTNVGALPSINANEIATLDIQLPPYNEQVAIAGLLTVSDRELELLNRDLDQEKQKKKALMQLLLSGVVRVNV